MNYYIWFLILNVLFLCWNQEVISSLEKRAATYEQKLLEAEKDIEQKAKSIQESGTKLEQLQEAMQRSYLCCIIYIIITISHLLCCYTGADWKRNCQIWNLRIKSLGSKLLLYHQLKAWAIGSKAQYCRWGTLHISF